MGSRDLSYVHRQLEPAGPRRVNQNTSAAHYRHNTPAVYNVIYALLYFVIYVCVNASGPRYIRRRLNAYYVSYVFPVHGCRAERKFLCDRNVTSVGHQTAHRLHYIAIETRGCVLHQWFPIGWFCGGLEGFLGGKIF